MLQDIKLQVALISLRQLNKAKDEIVAQVSALQVALEGVDLPQDALDALVALEATAQVLDDLNPDALSVEPEPATEPVADEPVAEEPVAEEPAPETEPVAPAQLGNWPDFDVYTCYSFFEE